MGWASDQGVEAMHQEVAKRLNKSMKKDRDCHSHTDKCPPPRGVQEHLIKGALFFWCPPFFKVVPPLKNPFFEKYLNLFKIC